MLNVMFNGLVEGGVEYDILHSGDVVVDSHTLDKTEISSLILGYCVHFH